MKCAVIAGGLGTRLRPIVGDLPKPMVPLDGVPLLERLIGLSRRFGIEDIHLMLGYRPEVIRDHFQDGSAFGVRITYWIEPQPMGTAGCMRQIFPALDGQDLLVLYGDVFVEMDLKRLIDFHHRHRPIATLVVHPNDHPHDSDLIEAQSDRIIAFHNKPHPEGAYYSNLVNAGAYVVTSSLLQRIPEGRASDFGHDVFPEAVAAGEFLAAYNTPEYIKDIGTPERYFQVENDIRAGKPARCNLVSARKAIFLDRDGTVNVWVPLLSRTADMELYPGAAQAIRAINQSDYLAVLTTNQPQVARGLVTVAELDGIHNKLETLLARDGAKLDGIYYCPHHPDRGYPEEIPELKISCQCRKPNTLLFELAAARFNIDLRSSAVIGDSIRDLQSARRLGCRSVLVRTGLGGSDIPEGFHWDYTARDLGEAVDWIIGTES